jgi:hypothetical protein
MFGAGIIGSPEDTPKWIWEFVSEVERANDFCTGNVYYKEAKKDNYYRGSFSPSKNIVCLYFSKEETDVAKAVVLHELAHALLHSFEDDTSFRPKKGKRKHHGEEFCKIVYEFYKKYNLIEAAKTFEYKGIVKFLNKMEITS